MRSSCLDKGFLYRTSRARHQLYQTRLLVAGQEADAETAEPEAAKAVEKAEKPAVDWKILVNFLYVVCLVSRGFTHLYCRACTAAAT